MKKYEVLSAGQWIKCKKAKEQFKPGSFGLLKSGWLHYELSDGTNGLAAPNKWREDQKDLMNRMKKANT